MDRWIEKFGMTLAVSLLAMAAVLKITAAILKAFGN